MNPVSLTVPPVPRSDARSWDRSASTLDRLPIGERIPLLRCVFFLSALHLISKSFYLVERQTANRHKTSLVRRTRTRTVVNVTSSSSS